MKKTILAAFAIVAVLVAAVLIIPKLTSMGHKEITREQSQENFTEYASQYKSFADKKGFEFEPSDASISQDGYTQFFTIKKDGVKFQVILTNSAGYETVSVRYDVTYSEEGKLQNPDKNMLSIITEAYNLIGAVEIDTDDILDTVKDDNTGVGSYMIYNIDTVRKCGDHPTQIIYSSESVTSECIELNGITKNCKK